MLPATIEKPSTWGSACFGFVCMGMVQLKVHILKEQKFKKQNKKTTTFYSLYRWGKPAKVGQLVKIKSDLGVWNAIEMRNDMDYITVNKSHPPGSYLHLHTYNN